MKPSSVEKNEDGVAPLAGAWIETVVGCLARKIVYGSLPSRERGLKLVNDVFHLIQSHVAPLAGAWIETKVSS